MRNTRRIISFDTGRKKNISIANNYGLGNVFLEKKPGILLLFNMDFYLYSAKWKIVSTTQAGNTTVHLRKMYFHYLMSDLLGRGCVLIRGWNFVFFLISFSRFLFLWLKMNGLNAISFSYITGPEP